MEKELEIREMSGMLLECIKDCMSEAVKYPTESTINNLRSELNRAKQLAENMYRQTGGIIKEDNVPEVVISKMNDAADYAVEMVHKREEFYIYMSHKDANANKKRLHVRTTLLGSKKWYVINVHHLKKGEYAFLTSYMADSEEKLHQMIQLAYVAVKNI